MRTQRKSPERSRALPTKDESFSRASGNSQPTDVRGGRQLVNALTQAGYTVTGIEDHWKCQCPLHGDHEPSLLIDVRHDWMGRRATFARCIACGNIALEVIDYFGLPRGEVLYGNPPVATKPKHVETLTENKVSRYANYLNDSPKLLAYLRDERGLNDETIRKYQVGYDEQRDRYVVPIHDKRGELVNLRRYLPHPPEGTPKILNSAGHGSPPRLYPLWPRPRRSKRGIIVCEGEWDCLLLRQHGFLAVTNTHGAGTWQERWSRWLADLDVAFLYDVGAEDHAYAHAARISGAVRVVRLPLPRKGDDVTDWFVTYGHTAGELRRLIRSVAPLGERKVGRS